MNSTSQGAEVSATAISQSTRHTLGNAVRALASVCDGAEAQDGVGFNKADTRWGRLMALDNENEWHPSHKYAVWLTLAKYRKQLQRNFGIEYDEIPIPEENHEYAKLPELPAKAKPKPKITTENGKFIVNFKYNAEMVAAIKRVPGRAWLNRRNEVANVKGTAEELKKFADDWGFSFSDEARRLLDVEIEEPPEAPKPVFRIVFDAPSWKLITPYYHEALVAELKAMTSHRKWDGDHEPKGWVCDASEELYKICVRFEIEGYEALGDAVADAIASAVEAEVTALTPAQDQRMCEISKKLLPYQVPAVYSQAIAIQNGGTLDASDTGTGKTYIALAVAAVLDRPAYVVCPKAVIPSWQRAAAHLGANIVGLCNYELLTRGDQPELSRTTITMKNGKKRHTFKWNLPEETLIIVDECHRLKDGATLNNKMGMAALKQGFVVFGLSATAADNPMQMKFVGTLTGLFKEGGHWNWALDHGVEETGYGYAFNGNHRILAEIHSEIFPKRGYRLRVAELGDAFPQSQIAAESYDVGRAATLSINAIYTEVNYPPLNPDGASPSRL